MSTRCAIAIADPDQLTAVYCHFDGYLSGVGKLLLEHWNTRALVRKLISMGDISSLGAGLGTKHDFDRRRLPLDVNEFGQLSETTFYGRDRGEQDVGPEMFDTADEYVEHMESRWCEFFYIFGTDDRWWVSCSYGPLKGTWAPLEESFQKVREFG